MPQANIRVSMKANTKIIQKVIKCKSLQIYSNITQSVCYFSGIWWQLATKPTEFNVSHHDSAQTKAH